MLRGDIASLTSKLIRFQTTQENTRALNESIRFSADYFKRIGGFVIRRFSSNGKPSLVASFDRLRKPQVALLGHLDVVNASAEQFRPKRIGQKIFGRGAGDMKGQIAVFFEIMKYFSLQQKKPPLALILTTDEESGGYHGARYLARVQGFHPSIVLVPDSGIPMNEIVCGEKGVLHIRVKATGVAAHASEPWNGENAIEKLFLAQERMVALLTSPKKKNGDRWIETINIGTIRGGSSISQTASHAEMACDIRFTEKYTPQSLLKALQRVIPFCRITQISHAETTRYNLSHPVRKTYKKIVEQVIKRNLHSKWEHGASDGRHFISSGSVVIVHAPTSGDIHGSNEWIDVRSQVQYYEILKRFVSHIAS